MATKMVVFQEGGDEASNTKYFYREGGDPNRDFAHGRFTSLVLEVPEKHFDNVLRVINAFKGPRAKFHEAIAKVLNPDKK